MNWNDRVAGGESLMDVLAEAVPVAPRDTRLNKHIIEVSEENKQVIVNITDGEYFVTKRYPNFLVETMGDDISDPTSDRLESGILELVKVAYSNFRTNFAGDEEE